MTVLTVDDYRSLPPKERTAVDLWLNQLGDGFVMAATCIEVADGTATVTAYNRDDRGRFYVDEDGEVVASTHKFNIADCPKLPTALR